MGTDGMAHVNEQLWFVVYHQRKWCKQFKYFGTSIQIGYFKSQKLVIKF